ncbi:hypothetical protein [Streptomyces sp. NBC_01268]|uniref:hypothetical protein n=1 Tax=Streptomyces sp. NBC_01268 TaxID=2903806 RepID=UPI002E3265F6|nr:hypothetical protein [Streptomyces sp. NBC_01268]
MPVGRRVPRPQLPPQCAQRRTFCRATPQPGTPPLARHDEEKPQAEEAADGEGGDEPGEAGQPDRVAFGRPLSFGEQREATDSYYRFAVCGDAARRAKDVDRMLREVVARHGRMDEEAAAAYVKQMSADKRYVRDVY